MSESPTLPEIAKALLETDALTGNDSLTPSMYYVNPDDVEYLVETVLGLAGKHYWAGNRCTCGERPPPGKSMWRWFDKHLLSLK